MPTAIRTLRFRAPGQGPLLHARLRSRDPAVPAVGRAVLCHPHPAFGGTMDVWLLPRIGEELGAHGWDVLRFDFRGAGGSEGTSGDGRAESDDVLGALAALRAAVPDSGPRTALVGWSFGALAALLAGLRAEEVTDWVGIGTPTQPIAGVPLAPLPVAELAAWRARRTVLVGEHDAFFPPERARALGVDRVVEIPGADHFLFDRDDEVALLVAAALEPRP